MSATNAPNAVDAHDADPQNDGALSRRLAALRARATAPLCVGDLIFVRPPTDGSDPAGELIARATSGPYCHVRIVSETDGVADGEAQVVEALARSGVHHAYLTPPYPNHTRDVARIGALLAPERRAFAVGWLLRQVGDAYSFWDIAADAVCALLPARWGSRTPLLVAPSAMDCSALAALFLLVAGYEWPSDALIASPERMSPNDLARLLGLVKGATRP